MNIQKMPVIQSCPFQRLVRNVKAQGTDQVQVGARDGAGAGNVARVGVDLGLIQYNVELVHRVLRRVIRHPIVSHPLPHRQEVRKMFHKIYKYFSYSTHI